ncbi:MAG: transposase [Victivallaceae bacterium]|nr:transposase [Victivallaceae bacterium]
MMKREQYFKSFLGNPDLRIDNNVSERNIKPVILGRKNWLFVGSENGGQTTAAVMSLVQTCKNLKINPRTYLEDTLRKINNTPKESLYILLPHKWEKT